MAGWCQFHVPDRAGSADGDIEALSGAGGADRAPSGIPAGSAGRLPGGLLDGTGTGSIAGGGGRTSEANGASRARNAASSCSSTEVG